MYAEQRLFCGHAARFLVAAGLTVQLLSAQESTNSASIGGRVTDAAGAVLQSAQVTVLRTETNFSQAAVTGADGRFRFPFLKVGEYRITVAKSGFAGATRAVTLTVGAAFDLPLSLDVESAHSRLTVTSEAPVLEASRSQIAGTVSQAEVQNLPLNGRNFLDLALLVPGVSPTNTGSNQLFAETSAVPGQGLSIGSQRNFSNSFIVDGLSANDDAAGLSGIFYGLDVVDEFQVVTSGGQAEFGRALGGYINMVTKSGGNLLQGDLYGYFRNQRWNAANPLSHARLPSTQSQYGASLAGPVKRDRTFYFANFEQRLWNQSGLITITPENVSAINARLAATGYPGPAIATGTYPNPVHQTNFLAKADHRVTATDQFSLRYSLYHVESENSRGAGALSAVTASAGLRNTDQTIAVSNVAALTARFVNETRGQFTASHLNAPPSDPLGPAVNISGVASFGTLSGSPTARENKLFEIVDNLSYQAGAHALKAGADFLYNDLTITFPRAVRGSYSFASLANFSQGIYNNSGFTQTFGNPVVAQNNPNPSVYAQDEWKATRGLTLNLGVRYDLQFLKTIATRTSNISPRAGFAWSPASTPRMVIRGSYGLFYDRIPLRALANALLSSGNTTTLTSASQVSVSLSPSQTGAPPFPNALAGLPGSVLANFSTMDRHIRNAYSEQSSLELERQWGAGSTLSVSYQHLRGVHLIASLNQNVPACAASGMNNGCRPNPSYGNNSRYSSVGDSHYDGLQVSFVQRPVRWGNYRVSYTYSKALDDVGEFFFSSPVDNFNIWRDYGRSDDDQRHRVIFDGSLRTPSAGHGWRCRALEGFQLSGSLQYYSALPLNLTTGSNTIQGTAARPILGGAFIARNSGAGPDNFVVNGRLSRSFELRERRRLEVLAEMFNLLNRRNELTRNGVFGTGIYPANPAPTFGQTTAVNDPRGLQLAVRLHF